MDKALTWFIGIWIAFAAVLNLVAIAGLFLGADNFWHGWLRVSEIYSPFNVINYAMEVALISPAIGAYIWLERRRKRVASATKLNP